MKRMWRYWACRLSPFLLSSASSLLSVSGLWSSSLTLSVPPSEVQASVVLKSERGAGGACCLCHWPFFNLFLLGALTSPSPDQSWAETFSSFSFSSSLHYIYNVNFTWVFSSLSFLFLFFSSSLFLSFFLDCSKDKEPKQPKGRSEPWMSELRTTRESRDRQPWFF